jgi:peptidyl-prolyl cis-trans isomerase B (cyclophilin B)
MKNLLLPLVVLVAVLSGCKQSKDYVVTIHTEFGDMKAILYEETPRHKENFIELVQSGAYDSTTWHRVIQDFMIQGGDVYAKEGGQEPAEDRIPAEIVDGFYHTKGALAAARQGDQLNPEKKSSGTQFYIVDGRKFTEDELTTDQVKLNQAISQMLQDDQYDSLRQLFIELQQANDYQAMNQLALDSRKYVEQEMDMEVSKEFDPKRLELYTTTEGAPHLDNEYTVFGRVVEGLDVIDRIAGVMKNNNDRPVNDTYLTMDVEMVPKKEITEKYGYEYPE